MTVAQSTSQGGGVFLLCWGLFATPLGGLLATNYRGFAYWFDDNASSSGATLRKLPPWRWLPEPKPRSMVPLMRVLGGAFATVGVVALALGAVFTLRGQTGLLVHDRPPTGALAFVYPAMGAVSLFQLGRPRGVVRQAWTHGGRASAVGLVFSVVAFPLGFDLGYPSLTVLAFAAGGLSGISLFFVERRARRA